MGAILKVVFDKKNFLHGLKTFSAACLALFVSFYAQLSDPTWAFTTAYIVSLPSAGAQNNKIINRLIGTFVGAVVSLAVTGMFDQLQLFFMIALCLWVGVCVFFAASLQDSPYSYAMFLSGYTVAILGFSEYSSSEAAFNTAQTRFFEISVGMTCAGLVHHIFFPVRTGPAALKALDQLVKEAGELSGQVIANSLSSEEAHKKGHAFIKTLSGFKKKRQFAVQDTPGFSKLKPSLVLLENRLYSLTAQLDAIHNDYQRMDGSDPEGLKLCRPVGEKAGEMITRAVQDMQAGEALDFAAAAQPTQDDIDAGKPDPDKALADKRQLARLVLLENIENVIQLWQGSLRIIEKVRKGEPADLDETPIDPPFRDFQLGLVSAIIAIVGITIATSFWYATAWSSGASSITYVAVLTSLLAPTDDPKKASSMFFYSAVLGGFIGLLYTIGLLPRLTTFPELVLALLPFFLFMGILSGNDKTSSLVTPAVFFSTSMISFKNVQTYDFASSLNTFIASAFGVAIAVGCFAFFRPIGVVWILRRAHREVFVLLRRAAFLPLPRSRIEFIARMMGRARDLTNRLQTIDLKDTTIVNGSLASMQIGLDIIDLRSMRPALPAEGAASVSRIVTRLGAMFERLQEHRFTGDVKILGELETTKQQLAQHAFSPALMDAIVAVDHIQAALTSNAVFFGLSRKPLIDDGYEPSPSEPPPDDGPQNPPSQGGGPPAQPHGPQTDKTSASPKPEAEDAAPAENSEKAGGDAGVRTAPAQTPGPQADAPQADKTSAPPKPEADGPAPAENLEKAGEAADARTAPAQPDGPQTDKPQADAPQTDDEPAPPKPEADGAAPAKNLEKARGANVPENAPDEPHKKNRDRQDTPGKDGV